MKTILLGPIAPWQLYTIGILVAIGIVFAVYFILQNIRKNNEKK